MATKQVDEWTLDGALDELARLDGTMPDRQFAFILGAGASVKSGIPTGKELAQRWLRDMYLRERTDKTTLEEWVSGSELGNAGLTFGNAAEHYPRIFEWCFRGDREAGYAQLEQAMEGKVPSLGYSLLAEIIQNTRHKVVITTNFDNLVADALAMHAHQSPLVVAHESLAGFVRPRLRRPLVAKIHRDLFLNPKNDQAGVDTMEKGWTIALRKLFQYFTPVVVGYGGNDGSLMGLLKELGEGEIVGRMIAEPGIVKRDAIYREGLTQFPKSAELTGTYAAFLANRRKDYDAAEAMYKKALELDPNDARITDNYADFLKNQRKDYDAAEAMYKKALEIDPSDASITDNYAKFLSNQRKDYDAAEAMYKKALERDPSDASITGIYANFLADQRKDYDGAEAVYKKALELDPSDANTAANFASLRLTRGDAESVAEAGRLSMQAIKAVDRQPSQAVAEALLYACLVSELHADSAAPVLSRLKGLFDAGFDRGSWDFTPIFDAVLPRISADRAPLYRALGAAILEPDRVADLDAFPAWRDLQPTDPFGESE